MTTITNLAGAMIDTAQIATAVTFAALLLALLVAHTIADHWVQTSHQAATKGHRGRAGAAACLRHVATYTATTAALGAVTWHLLDLAITPAAFAAGQAVSAITHYWADRRYTLAWLATVTGRDTFYRLGAPRPGHDDNPGLGTGSYALDQSWHWLWLFTAALITAVLS